MHAEINNVSWKHDKPQGAETNLELTVVCIKFEGMKKEEVTIYYVFRAAHHLQKSLQ